MTQTERYSTGQVIAALRAAHGIQAAAAKALGCDRRTVANYIKRHVSVRRAYDDLREELVDMAENVVLEALLANDAITARWVLGTLGRARGWGDTVQVNQAGEVVVRVVYVDKLGERARPPAWAEAREELVQ